MFFMGTDFRKLKAPFIWYDILHATEVLSWYTYARSDSRMKILDEEGLSSASLPATLTAYGPPQTGIA
jgi:N-acetyl-anhydromuramyl-L-alanine amidase AmpD